LKRNIVIVGLVESGNDNRNKRKQIKPKNVESVYQQTGMKLGSDLSPSKSLKGGKGEEGEGKKNAPRNTD